MWKYAEVWEASANHGWFIKKKKKNLILKQIQAEVYYSVSICGTNTNRKESSAAVPGQQMQCGISTVHSLFATRRLQQNNLMQSQQAVKEDTRLPSPVSQQWQPHTQERHLTTLIINAGLSNNTW